MVPVSSRGPVTVTFAGSGDAFGSGGRYQACIHLRGPGGAAPVLLDCGATSLPALRRCGLDPGEVAAVFVSHLHGDHVGGIPFLLLHAQFARRAGPLAVIGPPGTARRLTELMEGLFPGSTAVLAPVRGGRHRTGARSDPHRGGRDAPPRSRPTTRPARTARRCRCGSRSAPR